MKALLAIEPYKMPTCTSKEFNHHSTTKNSTPARTALSTRTVLTILQRWHLWALPLATMMILSSRVVVFIMACIAVGAVVDAKAAFTLPALNYPYSGLENWIDTETMTIHHSKHHQAAVTNLNAALSAYPALQKLSLTQILQNIGTYNIPENVTRALRNNGGSHFNHALFWKTLRPNWYDQIPSYPKNVRSNDLSIAIQKSFGSYANFTTTFSEAALKVFGSGWTWLCYRKPMAQLAVVSTPNQDSPLMSQFVKAADQCTPILGIDMFEHAYYLKHRNLKADYIVSWWRVVDWTRVSSNLKYAVAGNLEALWL